MRAVCLDLLREGGIEQVESHVKAPVTSCGCGIVIHGVISSVVTGHLQHPAPAVGGEVHERLIY